MARPPSPKVCPECGGQDPSSARAIEERFGMSEPGDTGLACPACKAGILLARWAGIWD
jgi:RNA polymerase subunit RPABC4/transcription elongation factor Spt4